MSDLLAAALAGRRQGLKPVAKPIHWVAKPMQARFDLADQDAVFDAMEPRLQ